MSRKQKPHPNLAPISTGRHRLLIVVTCIFAATALWLITRNTLAQAISGTHPEWALFLDPNQPDALLNLVEIEVDELIRKRHQLATAAPAVPAERNVNASPPPAIPANDPVVSARVATLRTMTMRALIADPTSARAIQLLSQIAELENKDTDAVKLAAIAVQRSKHQPIAIFRSARDAFERKDFAAVLDLGDILIRTRPDLAALIYPMFAHLAEAPAATPLLIERMLKSPPWRDQLISGILPSITDPHTPLRLILALQAKGQPPSAIDIRSYINFLIARQLPQIAYYVWLQLQTPEQLAKVRAVNNGNFADPISGLAFDWTLKTGSGTSVEITKIGPNEHALRAKLNHGRAELGEISQLLLLSPGSHEFSARLKGEMIGKRGLKWIITCASQTATPLGETEMFIGRAAAWKEITFTLDVPQVGCSAQRLRLVLDARSASERLVTGDVYYTGITITRK